MKKSDARRWHQSVVGDPFQVNFFEKNLEEENELTSYGLPTPNRNEWQYPTRNRIRRKYIKRLHFRRSPVH